MALHGANAEFGLRDEALDVLVVARGGNKARGDLVEFDFAQADAATSTVTLGLATSVWVNVVTPTSGGLKTGIHAICLEAIADDDYGWVRIVGRTEAKVKKSSGSDNVDTGAGVVGATDRTLDNVGVTSYLLLGLVLGTLSGTPAIPAEKMPVWFDGRPGGLGTFVTGTLGGAGA